MTDGEDIQARLTEAARAREERAQLSRRHGAALAEVKALEQHVATLAEKLEAESRDVERLEAHSPARIWATLKGSHSTDLERETAERDAARYAVAVAEARRDAAEREASSLAARVAELGDVDAELARAMAAKEEWASGSDPALTGDLAAIAERRGQLAAVDREAREAYGAGRAAHELLTHAAQELGSAQSWSTWDTFGGGGLLTDMMKYDKVDQATQLLHRADEALRAFSRELADVNMAAVSDVQVDSMMRTFDVWFDNIFSDMAVRSRIQAAVERTDEALQQVQNALAALERQGGEIAAELADLDARRESLLLG